MEWFITALLTSLALAGLVSGYRDKYGRKVKYKYAETKLLPTKKETNAELHRLWLVDFNALLQEELTLHVFNGELVTTEEFIKQISYQAWLDSKEERR